MKAELAYYFEQELRFLRDALRRYAHDHPEAAAKLQLDADGEGYVDLERIVHGAALLNARTARKIDDGHAQIVEGFLNVVFPHFLRPLPALGIVQFSLDSKLSASSRVPLSRADDQLSVSHTNDQKCQFRLTKDVDIFPISIEKTKLSGPQYSVAPSGLSQNKQVSALQFKISRTQPNEPIADVDFGQYLRLHIKEPREDSFELYEFLLRHVQSVVFSLPGSDIPFAELPGSAICPVGLNPDMDRILEYGSRSFPGYGLLSELFAYPRRFNFLDIELPSFEGCGESSQVEVHVFLDEQSTRLEEAVDETWLLPNCCPVVNLFQPESRTLVHAYDPSTHEVPLLVDPVNVDGNGNVGLLRDRQEVYSVDEVELFNCETQESTAMHPIYQISGQSPWHHEQNSFWVRREYNRSKGGEITGSDVYLQTSPEFDADPDSGKMLQYRLQVTAMNRSVPSSGEIALEFCRFKDGVKARTIRDMYQPIRPYLPARELWRVVNHLALNQLTLLSVESLRQMLVIYDLYELQGGSQAKSLIRSLRSLDSEPVLERVMVGGRPTFVRATHVKIEIDGNELPRGTAFLFGSILSAFLSGFQSVNSCVRVTALDKGVKLGSWRHDGFRREV